MEENRESGEFHIPISVKISGKEGAEREIIEMKPGKYDGKIT